MLTTQQAKQMLSPALQERIGEAYDVEIRRNRDFLVLSPVVAHDDLIDEALQVACAADNGDRILDRVKISDRTIAFRVGGYTEGKHALVDWKRETGEKLVGDFGIVRYTYPASQRSRYRVFRSHHELAEEMIRIHDEDDSENRQRTISGLIVYVIRAGRVMQVTDLEPLFDKEAWEASLDREYISENEAVAEDGLSVEENTAIRADLWRKRQAARLSRMKDMLIMY